jgi:monoamine oxidase
MDNIIIIGAGLSSLTAAYRLKKQNIDVKILEAQSQIGGRIRTIHGEDGTPMEMGATWFGMQHQNLFRLLKELDLAYFPQHLDGISLFETFSFEPPQQYFVPANEQSAHRIKGGTKSLIEALYKHLAPESVHLNTEIISITDKNDHLELQDSHHNRYTCKYLISTVPPKLLINTVQFSPELPANFVQILDKTQTWMSGSVKFSVAYNTPFWREKGFSGSVFSQSGLATEIYDHSNFEQTRFAIKGFLNGSAPHYTFEERRVKVIAQLTHYFGAEAQNYTSYHDKIWDDKYIKTADESFTPPHYNNGHPLYRQGFMNEKLFFAGTETSPQFGGYMEGAVISAGLIATKISKKLEKY